jgi:hypothetical protein
MNNLTTGLVVAIALMGGFYAGFRYESGKVPVAAASAASVTAGSASLGTARNGTAGTPGAGGGTAGAPGNGAFAGRGGNAGTVTNLTAAGFTLHSASGTDTKVTFGSGAVVRKTVTGQLSELTDNASVTVTGQRDASGNLVATVITIVPAATPAGG